MTDATLSTVEAARQQWDVIVVGAGPAGSSAALLLARAGRRVLLVDRDSFPRVKTCGCCLNARALAALDALGIAARLQEERFAHQHTMVLAVDRNRVEVPFHTCRTISRARLDTILLEAAIEAGAHFIDRASVIDTTLQCPIRTARIRRDGAITELQSQLVLLASGLGAPVARRALGSDLVAHEARIGLGTHCTGPQIICDTGRLIMAVARTGYVGLVRLPCGGLNIAAAVDADAPARAGSAGAAVMAILQACDLPVPEGLHTALWLGTPALTRRPRRVAAPRLFAIGDAAGYVEPFTGEGIGWALTAAHAVLTPALEATTQWHPRLEQEWERAHHRTVRRHMRTCRTVAAIARHPVLAHLTVGALTFAPSLASTVQRRLNLPAGNLARRLTQ